MPIPVIYAGLSVTLALLAIHPESMGLTAAFVSLITLGIAQGYFSSQNVSQTEDQKKQLNDRFKKLEADVEQLTLNRTFKR